MSFNEISLENGLEIARLFAAKMKSMTLLDLNGNKFGEEGVSEVLQILEPIGGAVSTLSEDEGADEEEEEESEPGEEQDSGDEEEAGDEVDEAEYDDLQDYEEYDEEGDEYEEEEGEEEEEYEAEAEADEKFGSSNIVQQSTLFKPFNNTTAASGNRPNLFTALVANRQLKTNSVPAFDNFIASPDLNTLRALDDTILSSVAQLNQFDGKFLIQFLNVLAKVYESSTRDMVLRVAQNLVQAFSQSPNNLAAFSDEFLTQFGFLKSEEKNIHPLEITEKVVQLFANIFKENYFPASVKENILTYVKLRVEAENGNKSKDPKFISSSSLLIRCFSA